MITKRGLATIERYALLAHGENLDNPIGRACAHVNRVNNGREAYHRLWFNKPETQVMFNTERAIYSMRHIRVSTARAWYAQLLTGKSLKVKGQWHSGSSLNGNPEPTEAAKLRSMKLVADMIMRTKLAW